MLTDRAWEGVNAYLDEYVSVRANDVVLVVYSPDSREAAAWVSACLEMRGTNVTRMWMTPLRDDGFRKRLESVLPQAESVKGRIIILTFERFTMSHSKALREAVGRYDSRRCLVFRAISTGEELFTYAFNLTSAELSALNSALLCRFMKARSLHIETPAGTQLDVTLSPERFHWISNRGIWRPERFVILPAGEVATYPASISGTLVGDFALNVNTIYDGDSRLQDAPVYITISDSRAIEFSCESVAVRNLLDRSFSMSNGTRVGELGFGTNVGVQEAVFFNSHINERAPGVHLGFGQHNQPKHIVSYECQVHLDLITNGGYVWVDEDPVPLDLSNVEPSSVPHPTNFYDEDVRAPEDAADGDCCGLFN